MDTLTVVFIHFLYFPRPFMLPGDIHSYSCESTTPYAPLTLPIPFQERVSLGYCNGSMVSLMWFPFSYEAEISVVTSLDNYYGIFKTWSIWNIQD